MNIFDDVPPLEAGDELFEILLQNKQLKIERIVSKSVADGTWYDQGHDEWVMLLQGEAVLKFNNSVTKLKHGDYIHIPAHTKHQVYRTSEDALWLAIHLT